ncbi:MAG: SRPBCC family protein [Methylococcaceae bacterium]|jgi:ligand-binding SRPBCC domain-containing protein|nr:SRPBCC family protein [Methylococcaceae bacterium]MDZ4157001.1 SRPBCC family protein [Methylococcales bacterium]MDP2392721.1 SRPBCC family protein [Methylococcaceae bacterium]MDP3018586.1 SRPBCC family protein [Methylococcaceae bacterium]MDP3391341.1 SRPBCC family protein [Methylococcaceae bacterium]
MKIYQLYRQQQLNVTSARAWEFLSSPYHLNAVTPDFFNVEITSPVPESIYAGLMISYRMKAVFGIPMAWLSEVSHCQVPQRFIYQQRVGPFKFLSHEVRLTDTESGVVLEDILFYAMPLGWFGQLTHALLIGDKLKRIFDVRRDYLQAKWGNL